ncbi:MAG: hypothetical protein K8R11_11490 [Methanococcoides sp.]|nr:hypothetical protein [Methanococcoides sp.]
MIPKKFDCLCEAFIRTLDIEGVGDAATEKLKVFLPQVIGHILQFAIGEIVEYANVAPVPYYKLSHIKLHKDREGCIVIR